MDITEKDLQIARNLIRMGDQSHYYLKGYDQGVNDVLRTLWSDGHKGIVEELINSIEDYNKEHHPIKIDVDYIEGEKGNTRG